MRVRESMEFGAAIYYLIDEPGKPGFVSVRKDREDGPIVAGPFSTLNHSYTLTVEKWYGETVPVLWQTGDMSWKLN